MKNKLLVALICFLADVAVSVWSYLKMSNYQAFVKTIGDSVDSPDFQLQIYQVMLQTLTFVIIIFLLIHLLIYFFYFNNKKLATKYVQVYSALAIFSCLIIIVGSKEPLLILPTLAYGLVFYSARKALKNA